MAFDDETPLPAAATVAPRTPGTAPAPAGQRTVHATGDGLPPPPLAPVATTRQWLPSLQSLRGLAALWVALYHLQVLLHAAGESLLPVPAVRLGWLGVDLFFVLSAFLLGQPWIDGRTPRPGRFLVDRFLRIAPPYYAAWLGTALTLSLAFANVWMPHLAWPSLLFIQNMRFDWYIAVNPAFWSLAVEMQFYLLLPVLAPLFRSRAWPAWLALFLAVALLFRGLLFGDGSDRGEVQLVNFALPGFLGHFALGLAICRIRRLDDPVGSGVRRLTFLAGLPLVALPPLLWIPAGSINFGFDDLAGSILVRPLAACGFALIVLATASGGWVARALAWRPLEWLGRISYSLYLIHIPVQLLVAIALPPEEQRWAWAAAATAASIAAGWLLYKLVEGPAETWRRRRKAELAGNARPAAG